MASHHLAVLLSHSHECAWSIGDVVPLDAGTELRVVAVLLHTQALAVEEEFHLVAIGIGIERNLLACLTVPVFRKLSVRNIDAIPLDVATLLAYLVDEFLQVVREIIPGTTARRLLLLSL